MSPSVLVDPVGLIILMVVCALFGLLVGWMGGMADGRVKERERKQATWPDADDPIFRECFEETLAANRWPSKRKGELYESSYTRMAYLAAYAVVNRIGTRLRETRR